MKHIPQDKYNVAWFTLAECISRGEKVRALGVYRLLAHSIEDTAFRKQLEADILLAFDDKHNAIIKYQEAALIYSKNGKTLDAIAVCEHLKELDSDTIDYPKQLVELYEQAGIHSKAISNLKLVFDLSLRKHDFKTATDSLKNLDTMDTQEQTAHEHEKMIFALLRSSKSSKEEIIFHIKTCVDGFLKENESRSLNKFIATLHGINKEYAQLAEDYALTDVTSK